MGLMIEREGAVKESMLQFEATARALTHRSAKSRAEGGKNEILPNAANGRELGKPTWSRIVHRSRITEQRG